jgi:hypothetical protein
MKLFDTAKKANTIVDFTAITRDWAEGRMRQFAQRSVKFKIGELRDRVLVGRIYQFNYEAKHKDTLPYYDAFPYVIVLKKYKDGFLGLNLHYLSFYHRAILFDKLTQLARHPNVEPDMSSRLILHYEKISRVRKYRFHTPTLKRYLYNNLRSPVYQIPGNMWSLCLFLPTTDFMAKGRQLRSKRVHVDSRRQINKGK